MKETKYRKIGKTSLRKLVAYVSASIGETEINPNDILHIGFNCAGKVIIDDYKGFKKGAATMIKAVKKTYLGWEVEAHREKSLGGDTLLYYSLFDPSGCEIASGITTGSETPRQFVKLLCERIDREIAEKDLKVTKWLPKFVRVENELNLLLRKAAEDGIKPAIRVYENSEKLGKDVQSVEVSLVLGSLTTEDIKKCPVCNGKKLVDTGASYDDCQFCDEEKDLPEWYQLIRATLREYECFDMKMFEENGGYTAYSLLRQAAEREQANKR